MKTIAVLLALAVSSVAWSQDKPAAAPEAKAEALKPAAAPEAKPLAQNAKPAAKKPGKMAKKPGRRWHEDARLCLDKPTNNDVIKCAEEYL
jgi:hypothetical protein